MLRVQKKGVPAFFTFLPAFHTPTEWARGAVFCITPRIQRLWRTVWQGLGGLVTVKLRYKGKSFK